GKPRQRRIRHFFLRQCKKAIRQDVLLLNLMPGSLWRASRPPIIKKSSSDTRGFFLSVSLFFAGLPKVFGVLRSFSSTV
ncbi:hypothetical protein, partial [Escherichia coli]|uniref:hypothetical protein n=1 Tax=Escherichia coli TaxID=562 RepID=UPI003D3501FD